MLNDTTVTLQGWLGSGVSLRQAGETPVASFRVAVTPRRLNRRTGEWGDGETQWYTVSAWRGLAERCAASLRSGDPVIVHGRLTTSTWTTSAGAETTTMEVDASVVGHDLSWGTTVFSRAASAKDEALAATQARHGVDDVADPDLEGPDVEDLERDPFTATERVPQPVG
ncbi:single-stranded DNA-binding protein [Nocardioides bruguierae]|uniref:Single-stranded DNA-binding protein n=1 Tax=Nocardioides bruguierae TaxID=2945102 RepID=A0A9X2D6S8_9ACTN|nr:single-stranded DNA-binding protein [Nocardioides bruguierae]MCM0620413.1 single-stranded DNA-binding protein [Nocardioides bruguierae]